MSAQKLADGRAHTQMQAAARARAQALESKMRLAAQTYDGTYKDGVETLFKVAAPTTRIIAGIASTPTVNSHGCSLSSRGCMVRLPTPLLFSHGFVGDTRNKASANVSDLQIGEIFYVRKSPESVFVKAHVWNTDAGNFAWQLIQSGEARCFSGAADQKSLRLRGVVDGHEFYDEWTLSEVSVCRKGANPDCTFEIEAL